MVPLGVWDLEEGHGVAYGTDPLHFDLSNVFWLRSFFAKILHYTDTVPVFYSDEKSYGAHSERE